MPRRRLKLSYSSDEDTENGVHQLQDEHQTELQPQEHVVIHQPVSLNTTEPIPNGNISEPLQISDDDEDFIDVSDNLSPPSLPTETNSFRSSLGSSQVTPSTGEASNGNPDCPISEFLQRFGLKLRREWLDTCVDGLERSIPGFVSLDVAMKAKLCFEQFLVSDMNYSGGGILPENVDSMHLVDLPGPFVLQVDEIINISCPLRSRYQTAPFGIKRCLKLSITDGVHRVFGMEYRPIKSLEVLAPAGLKVIICNVHIRHGLLMLVPEAFEVLGGMVGELDAARLRLIDEINKPPRGRRTRTGEVPPLATRATLAAWPSNTVNGLGNTNYSEPQESGPIESNHQGLDTLRRADDEFTVPGNGQNAAFYQSSNIVTGIHDIHIETAPSSRDENVTNPPSNSVSPFASSRDENVTNPPSNSVSPFEEVCRADVGHPFILSGDREVPFTYLASLSAKWVAMKEKTHSLRGKIKCFLTGVKRFQYQQRYELQVYVDDGSLISEVLIDHNLAQKVIGHSPKDVTAALSSSDTKVVTDVKKTLSQFQAFLANFEGLMLVEMSQASHLPIALEMNQGCQDTDAWLLLRRLKSSETPQTATNPSLDPIDVSP